MSWSAARSPRSTGCWSSNVARWPPASAPWTTSASAPAPRAASASSGVVTVGQTAISASWRRRTSERVGQSDRPDRKVYELSAAGRERVAEWLEDTSWPKPAPAEFHLKLVAAAAAGLGDPVRLVDTQRHALLAGLAAAQRAALTEPDGSVAGLLLEGVVLRLQADLRWLEVCARYWSETKGR